MNRAKKLMKSVFKRTTRTMEEIHQECAKLAVEAGFKQYEIKIKTEELHALNDQIRKLSHEGYVVAQKTTKETQATAAT